MFEKGCKLPRKRREGWMGGWVGGCLIKEEGGEDV